MSRDIATTSHIYSQPNARLGSPRRILDSAYDSTLSSVRGTRRGPEPSQNRGPSQSALPT